MTKPRDIPIVLEGRPLALRPTFQAITAIEAHLGDDIVPLFRKFETGRLGARMLAIIITEGLKGAGHPATYKKVGAMVMEEGMTSDAVIVPVSQFFEMILTAGRDVDEIDGQNDQKKTEGEATTPK